jgi:hypothetical protein
MIWDTTFYFNGSLDSNSAISERSHTADRSKYGNLEINHCVLTRLDIREDFIALTGHKSFKSYTISHI